MSHLHVKYSSLYLLSFFLYFSYFKFHFISFRCMFHISFSSFFSYSVTINFKKIFILNRNVSLILEYYSYYYFIIININFKTTLWENLTRPIFIIIHITLLLLLFYIERIIDFFHTFERLAHKFHLNIFPLYFRRFAKIQLSSGFWSFHFGHNFVRSCMGFRSPRWPASPLLFLVLLFILKCPSFHIYYYLINTVFTCNK